MTRCPCCSLLAGAQGARWVGRWEARARQWAQPWRRGRWWERSWEAGRQWGPSWVPQWQERQSGEPPDPRLKRRPGWRRG